MFEIENETNDNLDDLNIIKEYVNYLVKKLEIESAIFNIIFITDDKIREINREYRKIDRCTDVISFALEDFKDISYKDFRLLGDIYISIDTAKKQAEEYNHSLLREICFLSTHGLLHLLGYDHMEKDDEVVMFKLQKELLDEYGIKR